MCCRPFAVFIEQEMSLFFWWRKSLERCVSVDCEAKYTIWNKLIRNLCSYSTYVPGTVLSRASPRCEFQVMDLATSYYHGLTSLCVTIFSFRSSRYFIVLDLRKNFNRQTDSRRMNEWIESKTKQTVSGKRIWRILHQPARRRYWFDRKVYIHSEKRFIYRVYNTTFLWKISLFPMWNYGWFIVN